MSMIETLLQAHPIRKSKAQKKAFREWFQLQAEQMGYTSQIHTKVSSNNIVIGDPETAKVTYTAHYDTPAVMPIPNFITPKNILIYILYQLLLVAFFFAVAFCVGALTGWLTKEPGLAGLLAFVSVYALIFLMMIGPANKNCANDNTSGVAAVMEIMNRLPEAERGKVAFILFDNEEKGLLGSSAYASTHKNFKKNGLLINLDCVGDGEHMFFFANKTTRALPQYAQLCETMEAQEGRIAHMEAMEKAVYPSDQAHFKYGIAVCACNKMNVVGYYVDKIHTRKDTVCEQVNLDFLADGLVAFAGKLNQETETCSGETPAKAADPAARRKKWLSALLGLVMAVVGMALLMVYIKEKGDAPLILLMAGAALFGIGFVNFIIKPFLKEA